MNGIYDDYSYTEISADPTWWTVNLQSKYSIGRVELHSQEQNGELLDSCRLSVGENGVKSAFNVNH